MKPEFKQGKQVLATRPQFRYNPRPARSKLKSDSNRRSGRRSDSSDSNDSDSNTNTTNRDDDDNESSEESEFVQKLIDFHEAQDSQIPKMFWSGLKRVNLLSIYQKVKQMGGYELVTEQKMWKYLFGIDGGYNSISKKKYEKVILPFEKYEMLRGNPNNNLLRRGRSAGYDFGDWINDGEHHDGSRRLTEAEICEIQRQIKAKEMDPNVHLEMTPGSLPVTVIVGNQKSASSPSQFKIQQPHTTITVHQTTIHPQTLAETSPPRNPIQITNQIQIQQITVQPSTSQDQNGSNKRKSSIEEFSGRDGSDFVANHLAKLGKTTSLRHVRVKSDRAKDRRSAIHSSASSPIGSITVSAIKPNEKENIPYLSGSKTTTITPIINNKSLLCYPTPISDVIDLAESDNETGSSSPSPQSHLYSGNAMFPNMKKRKLDILRQGGLEVTAISNSVGPLTVQSYGAPAPITVPPVNSTKLKTNINQQQNQNSQFIGTLADAPNDIPIPKFQSKCMYTKTGHIFGNPKDLIPLPAQSTEYNCIDLTVEKCEPSLPIGLRLPQSTTIQKAHSQSITALTNHRLPHHQPTNTSTTSTSTSSTSTQSRLTPSAALAAQKITDPNLQITLVPPLTHAHNSSNYNNKRKSNEMSGGGGGGGGGRTAIGLKSPLEKKQMLSASGSSGSSAVEPTILNVPNLTAMNDLKINQLLLQNFLNQSAAANAQANQTAKETNATPSVHNPFLPMLDPVYLSSMYNNPNLFFQQALPQELLQLYKNFPQGLGIIPISKS